MTSLRRMTSTIVAVVLLLAVPCVAQQPTNQQIFPPPADHVIVSFMGPVDNTSISNLLRTVTDQMRVGKKRVTIIISSQGGDTTAAFAAYNVLRNLPIEVETFNVGNVDSAAVLLFCAGKKRFSLPGTRFLIHGNAALFPPGVPLDAAAMDAQLQQLKSLNQMVIEVVSSTTKKKQAEIENAVHGQQILSPELAKEWGLVQEIKPNFMEPGSMLVSVSVAPPTETEPPIKFTSVTPTNAAPVKQ